MIIKKSYNKLSDMWKEKYGTKICKIPLDAGFYCPNHDGTISFDGCIFCRKGSVAAYVDKTKEIASQLEHGIARIKPHKPHAKFISYFQAYSNTYAPVEVLKSTYDQAVGHPDVVGLSIGTRPDCLDTGKIALINSYAKDYEVWLEIGLQSAFDETLKTINRHHTVDDFVKAVDMAKDTDIKLCTHVILGLPGETKKDMLETVKFVASLPLHGIKIHLLHVIKDTYLETMYNDGKIKLMEMEEYADLVAEAVSLLPKDMLVHRLTGEAGKNEHVAPLWALRKGTVIKTIDQAFVKNDLWQGKFFKEK